MSSTEAILGTISVLSFGITLLTFVRSAIAKSNERANVELLKQRIASIDRGLAAVLYSTDAIVQIPKSRKVTPNELQDLARIVRAQLAELKRGLELSRHTVKKWQYGKLIPSDEDLAPIEDESDNDDTGQSMNHPQPDTPRSADA